MSKRGSNQRLPPGPIRAALLHAAGTICLRQQLWGKSKAYLLESLAADRNAATLLALARLADAIGDEREAAAYFKEAATAFAAETKATSDAPAASGARLSAEARLTGASTRSILARPALSACKETP